MGLGAIFVTLAVLVGVSAYVAWPFRRAALDADRMIETWVARVKSEGAQREPVSPRSGARAGETPAVREGKRREAIAAVPPRSGTSPSSPPAPLPGGEGSSPPRSGTPVPEPTPVANVSPDSVGERGDEDINFCPYCGRRIEPDHLFCPKCGRQLVKGGAA
jgi:hypothetical protein